MMSCDLIMVYPCMIFNELMTSCTYMFSTDNQTSRATMDSSIHIYLLLWSL